MLGLGDTAQEGVAAGGAEIARDDVLWLVDWIDKDYCDGADLALARRVQHIFKQLYDIIVGEGVRPETRIRQCKNPQVFIVMATSKAYARFLLVSPAFFPSCLSCGTEICG